jgi:hypothetical protein
MPLVIRTQGPYAVPQVVCDHCQTVIARAAEGNYQWRQEPLLQDTAAPMVFTHKHCCHAFEHQQGGSWGAIGLEALPAFLATNLQVPWSKAQAQARLMSGL